eukprot:UN15414
MRDQKSLPTPLFLLFKLRIDFAWPCTHNKSYISTNRYRRSKQPHTTYANMYKLVVSRLLSQSGILSNISSAPQTSIKIQHDICK